MKTARNQKRTDHSGSTFDSFLKQEGIEEEVEAVAIGRVLVWQRKQEHRKLGAKTKSA